MNLPVLLQIAETVVNTTRRELPPPVQELAAELPVAFHTVPTPEILDDEFEPDILGLFVGAPHGEAHGDANDVPAQIHLFVQNIWDFAQAENATFEDEVSITYLHELGHYLGWDEDDLEDRGLD